MDSLRKIKREPFSDNKNTSSSSAQSANVEATSTKPLRPIKKERLSPYKEPDNDEDDELEMPDPDKPRNYKRIQRPVDSDSEEDDGAAAADTNKMRKNHNMQNKNNNSAKASDDNSDEGDDVYVPLCEPGSSSGSEISESDVERERNDDSEKQRGKRKRLIMTRNTRRQLEMNKKSNNNKTSSNSKRTRNNKRRRANGTSSDSSSFEDEGLVSETQSMDGFIVADDEDVSDPEEDPGDGNSSHDNGHRKKSTTAKRKIHSSRGKQSPRPKRARSSKPNTSKRVTFEESVTRSSSSDSSLNDLFTATTVRSNRMKKPNNNAKSKSTKPRTRSQSSSSQSSFFEGNNDVLDHDVVTAARSFGVSVSSKRYPRRRRRSSAQQHAFFQNPPEFQEQGGESDDSFIDNETGNYGNLESSSSSDEEVVQEDEGVLDLNSDNYEEADSSSEDDEDDDDTSDKSQSDSDGSEKDSNRRQRRPSNEEIEAKCVLCKNLGDTDFRNRDMYVTADKWCKCKECRVVSKKMRNYDRVCCRELEAFHSFIKDLPAKSQPRCITRHTSFRKSVLHCDAYIRSRRKSFKGSRASKKAMGKEIWQEFKNAADREKVEQCKVSFIRWMFKRNDIDHKMVVPICVLKEIRSKYVPSAGPLYFDSFALKKSCQYNKHCKNAIYHI